MRAGVLVALVLLGACAFGSERALFGAGDGAQPFADGAHFLWIENGGQRIELVFSTEADGRYTLAPTDDEDPLRGVLLVPITETPEQDYVAQVRLNDDNDAAVYGFLWRVDEGYRVVIDPGRLMPGDDLSVADHYCTWQSFQGCGLSRREDVFGVYRALIHPRFVVGSETPESYIDLLPAGSTDESRRKDVK